MFGLISFALSILLTSWRYLLSACLGGSTITLLYISNTILIDESGDTFQALLTVLLPPTLYNSLYLAVCAIPVSFSLIFIGRVLSVKSWLYYMLSGGLAGFSALWILVEVLKMPNISLSSDSIQLMITICGGIISGLYYKILSK